MGELFSGEPFAATAVPRHAEQIPQAIQPLAKQRVTTGKPWGRVEQALKATDLLLQGGGFAAIVLDLGGIAPEYVSRIELSVWFRYRAAVERSRSSLVLLTKHPCAKSAGELLLRLYPGKARDDEATVFTGAERRLEVERRRFTDNLITLKKPPQSTYTAWKTQPAWAVR
jgi:hypothetical protein